MSETYGLRATYLGQKSLLIFRLKNDFLSSLVNDYDVGMYIFENDNWWIKHEKIY